MARQFRFVGDGAGVPGLPHVISEDQARSDGVLELLEAAIQAGNYVEDTSSSPAA